MSVNPEIGADGAETGAVFHSLDIHPFIDMEEGQIAKTICEADRRCRIETPLRFRAPGINVPQIVL